jgi:hypothetical protein
VLTLRHLPTPSPLADYAAVSVTSPPSAGTRGGSASRPTPRAILERLRWHAAPEPIVLMAPLEVVVLQEPVEVTPDLGRLEIPGRAPGHPEALIE